MARGCRRAFDATADSRWHGSLEPWATGWSLGHLGEVTGLALQPSRAERVRIAPMLRSTEEVRSAALECVPYAVAGRPLWTAWSSRNIGKWPTAHMDASFPKKIALAPALAPRLWKMARTCQYERRLDRPGNGLEDGRSRGEEGRLDVSPASGREETIWSLQVSSSGGVGGGEGEGLGGRLLGTAARPRRGEPSQYRERCTKRVIFGAWCKQSGLEEWVKSKLEVLFGYWEGCARTGRERIAYRAYRRRRPSPL
ncbi:hypothetical protein ONZ51_g9029 [Trametes cubensis]|uniref:Uncharacterized protein n=1 Tax=Trametes cubensis TaxID=1111947 RepID=A0AAD7TNC1_9APHY|nr:hypothetical protein ONZ51_g9029 [Trametes cubensis]